MWFVAFVFFWLITVLFYLKYVSDKKKYKDIEKIPGPPTWPLLGNILEFGHNICDIFHDSQRIIKTYGPFVRVWQGPFRLNLFVTDPDYVEYFLSSTVHINKSSSYRFPRPWLGLGLITSGGDRWRHHRKIITPAFHFKVLDQFSDTFHTAGRDLIDDLKKEAGNSVDIYQYIKLYAMNVICESSMRINPQHEAKSIKSYLIAADAFLSVLLKRFFSVLMQSDFYYQFTSDYSLQKKCVIVLHSFTRRVLQLRKKEKVEDSGSSLDEFGRKKKKVFVDILLESNQLSDEEIREEVDTFVFAGHHTISSAMSFCLFELAKHFDIQQRLLEEIHGVVGNGKDVEITVQHLQQMNYLDRVMKESLRLYAPVPFFERELMEDIVLDGKSIPKGTKISFHPYSQHRNEKYFPEPEKFNPDRFLPENVVNMHRFAYIPFSAGPRNCIGFKYALINSKTTIANVIRNFEIYPVYPVHKPVLANDGVLKSMNGLPVILKSRA